MVGTRIYADMTFLEKFWTIMGVPRNVGWNPLGLIRVRPYNPLSSYLKARP
jgi:hypothetical protein